METIQVSIATGPIQDRACVSSGSEHPNASDGFFFLIALNPDPKNLPKLDPKDQFLLGDSTGSSLFVSTTAAGSSTPHAVPTVTWLRKTEYITSREGNTRSSSSQDQYVPPTILQNLDSDESPRAQKEEPGGSICRHLKISPNTRYRGLLRCMCYEFRFERAQTSQQTQRYRRQLV